MNRFIFFPKTIDILNSSPKYDSKTKEEKINLIKQLLDEKDAKIVAHYYTHECAIDLLRGAARTANGPPWRRPRRLPAGGSARGTSPRATPVSAWPSGGACP